MKKEKREFFEHQPLGSLLFCALVWKMVILARRTHWAYFIYEDKKSIEVQAICEQSTVTSFLYSTLSR